MANTESVEKPEDTPKFNRLFCCPKTLILIIVPIASSMLLVVNRIINEPGSDTYEHVGFRLGWVFMVIVVGIFWITNALTITLTGFLPIIALPLLGVVKAIDLANAFMSNSNIATFGTVALMMAMDTGGLRRRLTLKILTNTSNSIRWIYIYVFLSTVWIAMWISSVAATYFMMEVVDDILGMLKSEIHNGALGDERIAVLDNTVSKVEEMTEVTIEKDAEPALFQNQISPETEVQEPSIQDSKQGLDSDQIESQNIEKESLENENEQLLNDLGGELIYAVCVAANLGGTLWPFGSTVGYEMMKLKYVLLDNQGWTEASWMIFSMPLIVVNAFIALNLLLWFNFSGSSIAKCIAGLKEKRLCNYLPSETSMTKMSQIFTEKHNQLGPWMFHEKALLFLVIFLICTSITRLPLFMKGWSELLPFGIIEIKNKPGKQAHERTNAGASVTCMIIVLLLFAIPKAGCNFFKGPKTASDKPKREGLLGWKALQTKYPWAVIILIGSSRVMGIFAEKPICELAAKAFVEEVSTKDENSMSPSILLRILIIGTIIICNNFIGNTGATVLTLQLWEKIYKLDQNIPVQGIIIFPAFSVAALCFIVPASSIPTAIVYRYQGKKSLSAWYFLRVGTPILLCTLIPTVTFALCWTPRGFENV